MPRPRHAWILDAPRDLLLLVATPVLILPLLALARASWSDTAIAGVVLAFGATGHQLPGLLRAYGDRDLFERFRARFIFGPVLLFIVCLFFYTFHFQGMIAMVTAWGTWHALAQVYGFGRIYDAKVGAFDPRTAQLDKALCIAWFVLPLTVSPWRLLGLFEDVYISGLPVVSAANLAAFQSGWWAATGVVTLLWLANFAKRLVRGEPANPVKAALFLSSIAFWYYAISTASHAIVGLAMFELFHDTQYLTIVWLYNRKRAEQPGAQLSRVLRSLFGPGIALVGLYVAGVLAFGGLDFVRQRLPTGELVPVLSALFAMSSFLHYYFDSFIWNLRDPSTRAGLAVDAAVASSGQSVRAWLPQLGNWAWFAVPLGVLVAGQVVTPRAPLAMREAVTQSLPNDSIAWLALGELQREFERPSEAVPSVQRGLRIDPDSAPGWGLLAELGSELGRPQLERSALERLITLRPETAAPRLRLAINLERAGEHTRAREELQRAQALDPNGTADLLPSFQRAIDGFYQPGSARGRRVRSSRSAEPPAG